MAVKFRGLTLSRVDAATEAGPSNYVASQEQAGGAFGATIAVTLATTGLQDRFEALRNAGGVIGTGVSALFLLVIAIVNLVILIGRCLVSHEDRDRFPMADER